MAKTREIKKRIKAVGNIRRITKTMQMIATSKFARAQQRAELLAGHQPASFEVLQIVFKMILITHSVLPLWRPSPT